MPVNPTATTARDGARTALNQLRRTYRTQVFALPGAGGLLGSVSVILLHIGIAIVAAALTVCLWQRLRMAAVIAYPACMIVVASRMRALGNLLHECSHRTLVRGARSNRALGNALSFILFIDFTTYTEEHLSHHRYLGDPVRDRDFATRRALFAQLGPFGPAYVRAAILLRFLPLYLRPVAWSPRDFALVRLVRIGFLVGLAALAHWVVSWAALGAFFLVPYATAYQALCFWSDATDHAGAMSAADELSRSRNHLYDAAWLNWLVFPRNDQYHLVHHIFPSVSTRNLPRVHAMLLDDPGYASMGHRLLVRPAAKLAGIHPSSAASVANSGAVQEREPETTCDGGV
jgi:fatty acid desaturase